MALKKTGLRIGSTTRVLILLELLQVSLAVYQMKFPMPDVKIFFLGFQRIPLLARWY